MELLVFYIAFIGAPVIIHIMFDDKVTKALFLLIYLVLNIALSIFLLLAGSNCGGGAMFCINAPPLVLFQIPIYISLAVCLLINKTPNKKSYHYDDD